MTMGLLRTGLLGRAITERLQSVGHCVTAGPDGSTGSVAPGYAEDAFEVRTTLAGLLSILPRVDR